MTYDYHEVLAYTDNAARLWAAALSTANRAIFAPPTEDPEQLDRIDLLALAMVDTGGETVRETVTSLAILDALEEGWNLCSAHYAGNFDWEFCPFFLLNCIRWDEKVVVLRPNYRELCISFGESKRG